MGSSFHSVNTREASRKHVKLKTHRKGSRYHNSNETNSIPGSPHRTLTFSKFSPKSAAAVHC